MPISIITSKDQHSEKFRQVNPLQKVPALVIDGHTLIESLSIIHYLEETRPSYRLLPLDLMKRTKAREISEVIASGIQPLQNVGLLAHLEKGKKREWAQQWIKTGFTALETLLRDSAGKYCVGNEITIADCCLVPQVYNARLHKVDVTMFPIISRIDSELMNHEAFQDSHPLNQPDAPTDENERKMI